MAGNRIRLNSKVVFRSPSEGARTPTGGSKQGWADEFSAWADVRYLRGGEAVMESRMKGRRPAILTLRKRAILRGIALDWSVVIASKSYEVRELPRPREDGAFVELMVEAVS